VQVFILNKLNHCYYNKLEASPLFKIVFKSKVVNILPLNGSVIKYMPKILFLITKNYMRYF